MLPTVDEYKTPRLFTSRSIAKTSVTAEDLNRATRKPALLRRVCRVDDTFDLKWTNRYNFDFADSENEAVTRSLRPKERGGTVVFPVNAKVGADTLSFTVAWLMAPHDQLNRTDWVVKIEQALKGSGFPSGNIRHRFRGRYRNATSGVWFNEKSPTLELQFIPEKELLKLAAALALVLKQPVLLKTEAKGEVYFVNAGAGEAES